jgi:tRNA-binding protein
MIPSTSSCRAAAYLSPITLAEFNKLVLVIAKVLQAAENTKAKVPAYLITLDPGHALLEEHQRLVGKLAYTSSAQLRSNHSAEELCGASVLSVLNFPRKQIGPNLSDCLVTGVQKEGLDAEAKRASTVYVRPTHDVPPGSRVGLFGEEVIVQTNPRDLQWDEFIQADFRIARITQASVLRQTPTQVDLKVQLDCGQTSCRQGALRITRDFPIDQLIGKQVLVLTNLAPEDLVQYFPHDVTMIVCSIAGRALLEPARPVENGFKLA